MGKDVQNVGTCSNPNSRKIVYVVVAPSHRVDIGDVISSLQGSRIVDFGAAN